MGIRMHIGYKHILLRKSFLALLISVTALSGCADAEGPKARDANIPPPVAADGRKQAINERPDPVQYLPLGEDVLLPESEEGDALPSTVVGPFELRNETLAGALQLVMDGTDIPVSFETSRSLENTVTVTNLKGPINEVVQQICGLADLYCSYERGVLNVKDTQIFTVSIPPIAAADQVGQLMTNVSGAIAEITGSAPITDPSTRTIVYRATERTSEVARRYFQRLRQNTALIVFETYIWEVSLNSGNTTGINWEYFDTMGKFNFGLSASGSTNPDLGTPISIGLPTTEAVNLATGDVLRFISDYGAVKTISQPQITVLAGSEARLRIADTTNYLASVSRTTTDGGTTTTSTTTDSVDSGFTLVIGSNWDNATVYGNINILLQEVRGIEQFEASEEATIQLPTTSERELQTQVRVRPGDSLLIAGLVRERDNLDSTGPGINEPIIPTSRTAQTDNVELVFLLKPRVVVFTPKVKVKTPAPVAEFPVAALKAEAAELPDDLPLDVPAPEPLLPQELSAAPAVKDIVAEKKIPVEMKKEQPVKITQAPVVTKRVEPEAKKVAIKEAIPAEAVIESEEPQSIMPSASADSAIEQEKAMMPSARRITPVSVPAEDSMMPTIRRITAPAPQPVEKTSLDEDMLSSDQGEIL
ncbi:MAG: type II and III secretion system family protein [Micavibrio aeruginosavorus]|uniref:Type II and III secretion system family protein n=1 Tax=Micavibrio aeruginosavorus TaxID=349221 RepID=A0A2W5FRG9_9BACT|nr:MAG: type II and III secretion system family protein [Micavibrio aeruginosavorus]